MKTQLHNFIGSEQLATLAILSRGEEGEFFEQKIEELARLFETMPKTYEQDGKGDNAIVYLHYFVGGCDWYITERDSEPEQLQAFGLACIQCEELGYINIVDLLRNGAELDLYWEPKTLAEVRRERQK